MEFLFNSCKNSIFWFPRLRLILHKYSIPLRISVKANTHKIGPLTGAQVKKLFSNLTKIIEYCYPPRGFTIDKSAVEVPSGTWKSSQTELGHFRNPVQNASSYQCQNERK